MPCYFLYQTYKYLRDVACSCTTLISLPINLFLVAHPCILIVSNANQYYVFQPLLSFCTFLLPILFFYKFSITFSTLLSSTQFMLCLQKKKNGDYSLYFIFPIFFFLLVFFIYLLDSRRSQRIKKKKKNKGVYFQGQLSNFDSENQ